MNAEDVKVDLKELDEWKVQNQKSRTEFIEFWVNYVKTHSDEEWSEQQNILIDSQVKNALSVKNRRGLKA